MAGSPVFSINFTNRLIPAKPNYLMSIKNGLAILKCFTPLVTPCFEKKFVTHIADQERRERNPDNNKDQLKTTLHNTRTFYYLYTCKTVVLIIIYSSIELTLVFDRTDYRFRSKRPSIETTCYPSSDIAESTV